MKWWKIPLWPFGVLLVWLVFLIDRLVNGRDFPRRTFPPRWEIVGLMEDKGFFREL